MVFVRSQMSNGQAGGLPLHSRCFGNTLKEKSHTLHTSIERPRSTHRLRVETGKQVAPSPRVKDGQYSESVELLCALELCVGEAQHSRVPHTTHLPPRELAQDLSLLLMGPASLQVCSNLSKLQLLG